MGHSTRGNGIRTFWPDNTPDTLYIDGDYSGITLTDLMERIAEHFGADVDMATIHISSEHIHTDCLGYDRYDSHDYTNFIVITRSDT